MSSQCNAAISNNDDGGIWSRRRRREASQISLCQQDSDTVSSHESFFPHFLACWYTIPRKKDGADVKNINTLAFANRLTRLHGCSFAQTKSIGARISGDHSFLKVFFFFLYILGTTNGYYDSQARVRSYPNIAPQIVSPDQTFRSELGDRLVLPCQVANLDKFVLMWKQGNRLLTAGKMVVRKDSRIRLRDDFSLEIEELRAEDQDTYTCEIDVLGKPISIQHHVSWSWSKLNLIQWPSPTRAVFQTLNWRFACSLATAFVALYSIHQRMEGICQWPRFHDSMGFGALPKLIWVFDNHLAENRD